MNHSLKNKDKIFSILLSFVFILGLWIVLNKAYSNELVVPSFKNTIDSLGLILKKKDTYLSIGSTLIRIIISVLISAIISLVLAYFSFINKRIYYFFKPIISIARMLPIASIILVIILMFGDKGLGPIVASPIIVSCMLLLPMIYESLYFELSNINSEIIDYSLLETSSKTVIFRYVAFPMSLKKYTQSIKESLSLSFKVMVMAEYISQTDISIGKSLVEAKSFLQTGEVFAWTIILIILGLLFDLVCGNITKLFRK